MIRIIFLLLISSFIHSIYAQSNNVYIEKFKPYETQASMEIEEKIQKLIQQKLESKGFNLVNNKTQSAFHVDGYYTRTRNGNLNIYAQIYDPATNTLIDSVKATDAIDEESLGIKLDPNEMKAQDQERIETISDRVVAAIRSNPNKKVRYERLEENLMDTKIAKAKDFKVQKLDDKQASEEVFKIIGEESVVTATKRSQSLREVPGTVYVITEEDIRRYGYRDLQEILLRIPSMEMLREGAETKGGVRGFLGSAKPLMMINGREVTQHKPLSPYISHQFRANMIKRVEIVQGPASALYGANAFSGIINIITKDAKVTKDTGYLYGMGGDYRTYEGGASFEKKISENVSLSAQGYSFYTRGENYQDFWSPYNPRNWTFLGWYPRDDVNKGQAPYPVVSTGAPALGGVTPSYETDAAARFSELYPTRDPRSFFPFMNPARATGGNMEFQHKYFYVGLDYFVVQTGTYYPIKKSNHSNDHIERQLMTGFAGIRELPLFWGFNLSMDFMVQREDLKQQIQYGYSILEFDNDGNLDTRNANPFAQGVFANEGNMRYKGFIQFDKDFSDIGNYLIFGFGYDRYNTATSIANFLPGFVGTYATFLPRGNPAPWEPDERAFYKQNKVSFYVQDQQNLLRRSLQLTLGARLDKHNIYGTVFNPRIGLVYTPEFIKRNTFKFLYGTAFREPSVFEYSTNVISERYSNIKCAWKMRFFRKSIIFSEFATFFE